MPSALFDPTGTAAVVTGASRECNAGAAVMLASPAGAFVTGQNIVVDGGTLAGDGS